MGRGGPPEPELVEAPPTVEELVARSQRGAPRRVRPPRDRGARRGADDRLPPRGRRPRGRRRRLERRRGRAPRRRAAARPRALRRQRRGDPAGRHRPAGPRHRNGPSVTPTSTRTGGSISDLVVERPALRLRPTEPLEGRVAVFTAGATDVSHLDADVVHVSANLVGPRAPPRTTSWTRTRISSR